MAGVGRIWAWMVPPLASVGAAGALLLAPPVVGFSAAAATAFIWTWWLERDVSGKQSRTPMVLATVADALGSTVRSPQRPAPRLSPHRILVCLPPDRPATAELNTARSLADRLGGALVAARVVRRHMAPTIESLATLSANEALAEAAGATVIRVDADDVAQGLTALTAREGFTHVVFGYTGGALDGIRPGHVIAEFARRARGVEISVVRPEICA